MWLHPTPAGFLSGLRKICNREGALLIFDEVITGFRHHIADIKPSVVLTRRHHEGKAIANGFPMAAVGGKSQYMDHSTHALRRCFFSGTFNGHASCLAAALATIAVLETGDVHRHIYGSATRCARVCAYCQAGRLSLHGRGFRFGLHALFQSRHEVSNFDDLLSNDKALYVRYRQELMRRGVFEIPMN